MGRYFVAFVMNFHSPQNWCGNSGTKWEKMTLKPSINGLHYYYHRAVKSWVYNSVAFIYIFAIDLLTKIQAPVLFPK
jgi:hypothetical protein